MFGDLLFHISLDGENELEEEVEEDQDEGEVEEELQVSAYMTVSS
jgi:hypothetical protein